MSKKTLDFCLLLAGKTILHLQTENNGKGIADFIKQCKEQFDLKLEESLFCMEHTGIYNYPLLDYLAGKQTAVWLDRVAGRSALHIKHSSGLQRGKNDKIDAERIAFYAYRNQDSVKLWQPARQVIKELKTMTALRTRLINAKKQPHGGPFKSSLQEGGEFLDKALQKKMQQPPWRGAAKSL